MTEPAYRLRDRRDIRRLYRFGKNLQADGLLIKAMKSSQGPRLAVVVSTKISKKAVVRNRIRRRILELVRTHLEAFPAYDLVVIIQKDLSGLPHEALKELLLSCALKLKSID